MLSGRAEQFRQARWLRTIQVFNEQGKEEQLKLFPSQIKPPADDPQVARVLVNRVRLERTRQFGACFLGWELWQRLQLDQFFEQAVDADVADVPWSRVAALLAIHRLCAPGSELRALKSELWIRPLFHQKESRVKAHVLVAFLGYALWITLKHLLKRQPTLVSQLPDQKDQTPQPLSPCKALALLSTLHSADIVLPTTDGREIRLRRITEPSAEQKMLLHHLGLTLPERLHCDLKCSADSVVA